MASNVACHSAKLGRSGVAACPFTTTFVIVPLSMSQQEFQKYFEADVRDTEALAKAAGIEKQ